jgi:hypothetical protein
MKTAITAILLLFVAASVVYLIVGQPQAEPTGRDSQTASPVASTTAATVAVKAPAEEPVRKLVVYYFHRTQRCHTCLTMEAYAKDVLTQTFPKQFESGEIEWRLADIETPANEHFVNDFELTSNALVMIKLDGGEQTDWKSLDRIWELVGNEGEFKTYVRDEAQNYLDDSA